MAKLNHNGKLSLQFQIRKERTRLTACFQQPPLKASRELYIDDDQKATVYIMESSGGMVAGDRNEYDIHLQERTSVCLIQQSALKIYPSMDGLSSTQYINIKLDEGARLEWRPEVIIPFENAIFRGETIVQMKQNAELLWGEIISPGREKRGECFTYDELKTGFQIWKEGECLVYDTLRFLPKNVQLRQIGMLERSLYIGSLFFISHEAEHMNHREMNEQLLHSETIKSSVTKIDDKGLMFRWLSSDLWLLKEQMEKVWDQLSKKEFVNEDKGEIK
ncbi:urease accessory protein UreD [Bacillus chungangensis]|uniref:Urease accessory protein UreD n=1 Tax=Bacillus chungangensis TaxID=587633 RepID=A0ABT9WNN4_9BACI|nr:urease accessory protein UreD [Bacillus chungangensis]MDQ0174891.1 urease accessory protein [Bacillus chungangensis]